MKVILLKDVKNLGKKDQEVEVANGYAANYLFPNKLAVALTETGRKIRDHELEQQRLAAVKKQEEAQTIANQLADIKLTFKAKAAQDGRMIGTISTKQIVEKLKTDFNITIDKRKFIDHFQVNAFGITRLRIELSKGVVGVVQVAVTE